MKDKSIQLVKNLLILQIAGASDSVAEEIMLALEICCEVNGFDETDIKKQLKLIKSRLNYNNICGCDTEKYDKERIWYEAEIDRMFAAAAN